jgi:hypothetical protein
MKTPSRMPVRTEQFLINAIAISWPNIQNQDIRFHLNILVEQLQQELDRKMGRKKAKDRKAIVVENTENEDVRKFIALFRDRYAQETDMEYRTKLNPDELGAIKNIVTKLREKDVDIDDYLDWVFDVFFDNAENREKFTPAVKFICGTFMASKFFMSNRDRFRKKREAEERVSRRDMIREHGKILFRKSKDETIQKMLQREFDGTVTTGYLEDWLKKKEEELTEA